jgi:hypothetical protein
MLLLAALAVIASACTSDSSSRLWDVAATCPPVGEGYDVHVQCVGDALVEHANSEGIDVVMKDLSEMVNKSPDDVSLCHSIAHYASRQLVERFSVREMVSVDNGSCDFGFAHGAVEGLAEMYPESLQEQALELCTGLDEGSFRRDNCAHGIGHAFTMTSGASFSSSTQECAALYTPDQVGCLGAVLMAYSSGFASISEDVSVRLPVVDPVELVEVCDTLTGDLQVRCWSGAWMMFQERDAVRLHDQLAMVCRSAPTEPLRAGCGNGLGQAMFFRSSPDVDQDPSKIRAASSLAVARCLEGELRNPCIQGVALGAAAWWAEAHTSFGEYQSICPTLTGTENEWCVDGESEPRRRVDELSNIAAGGD